MTLAGANVAVSATESVRLDLVLRSGRIKFRSRLDSDAALDLRGFLILPGLVNAHDHLEFNLFPRLGEGPYPNATAWAESVYRPQEPPVRQHLRIPKRVRLFWGGIKNLISGVTSVLHHNPYQPDVFEQRFPVRVVKRFGWAHSLAFSNDVAERYARTPARAAFFIHAGEGSDAHAKEEIHQLDQAGVLGASTAIVHGVALDCEGAALVRSRGASLVWCPSSNQFILGRTVAPEVLSSGIPIALGSDSALTAAGDLIDELAVAQRESDLYRLYDMVTAGAARILRLESGEGTIRENGVADLVIVANRGQKPAEALLDMRPEMVLAGGRIKLLSPRMASRLRRGGPPLYHPIEVEGRGRWLIDCDVPSLTEPVRRVLDGSFCLAGRRVVT